MIIHQHPMAPLLGLGRLALDTLCFLLAVGLCLGALFLGGCCSQIPDAPDSGKLLYSPSAELWDDTQAAIDRLNAATGAGFSLQASGGTKIEAVSPDEMLYAPDDCGETNSIFYRPDREIRSVGIRINSGIPARCFTDLSLAIEHEMVHSARRESVFDVNEVDQGHSAHGIFQAYANLEDHKLEETSLTALCQYVDCQTFQPE